MPCSLQFGYGMQRLLDAQQRFMRSSLPFYLRRRNFVDPQTQPWAQLGFQIAPTGAPAGSSNSPVPFTFTAQGIGTVHSITVGTNTYLYTETSGQTSNQVAAAIAAGAVTELGLVITFDPYVSVSVVNNVVTLTPVGLSGAVIPASASDGNTNALMWITINPSLTLASTTGTTDTLIDPPPSVTMTSSRNILASQGKLRFGARDVRVSASFVDKQCALRGITKQRLVWEDSTVIGLVSENLVLSIESVIHEELAGKTIQWFLQCNCNELR